jgi:predicted nucleic acid-binding protein
VGLILDTSAIVGWERAQVTGASTALDSNETYALPAIVWAELLIGVRMAANARRAAQRIARLEAIRRVTGIEPFSAEIAEHYADIFFELSEKGRLIPQNDIAVAATARALKFDVLVGPKDEAHFREIPGLKVRVFGSL